MAKRNSKGRKSTAQARTSVANIARSTGLAGKFNEASRAVSTRVDKIPASAFYWGLGAFTLGAAAVGAYMYREQVMEVYDEAVESLGKVARTKLGSTEGRKSGSSVTQNDPH